MNQKLDKYFTDEFSSRLFLSERFNFYVTSKVNFQTGAFHYATQEKLSEQ